MAKHIYRRNGEFMIAKNQLTKVGDGKIDLTNLVMKIDPKLEDQIYEDSLNFRDYFCVDNIHGVDWAGIKETLVLCSFCAWQV